MQKVVTVVMMSVRVLFSPRALSDDELLDRLRAVTLPGTLRGRWGPGCWLCCLGEVLMVCLCGLVRRYVRRDLNF